MYGFHINNDFNTWVKFYEAKERQKWKWVSNDIVRTSVKGLAVRMVLAKVEDCKYNISKDFLRETLDRKKKKKNLLYRFIILILCLFFSSIVIFCNNGLRLISGKLFPDYPRCYQMLLLLLPPHCLQTSNTIFGCDWSATLFKQRTRIWLVITKMCSTTQERRDNLDLCCLVKARLRQVELVWVVRLCSLLSSAPTFSQFYIPLERHNRTFATTLTAHLWPFFLTHHWPPP